ncbi:SDR family NAD(P)-dependent oxidoreductase [Flavobacterium sp. MMLR14_040]|uniref:SDR family NAD(P)-dependent oxidoreductase n=1 Tax=Flavobacterium sp. MMLR14_040 TaxID=3093843 RepID=UPI0029907BAF|nr:SDR family NAD(P)-dependent oxidoreductase [Flavobacterium sp. MMLR14_040]MDW8850663.1 SDR family NAD(P)-dependent oxidoreductase [Flavobacterium sp. MMLR14_040]
MSNQKIWFVTGASKGMGLLLTKLLLNTGHKVAATSRNLGLLKSNVGLENDLFLPIELDITNSRDVKLAINQTVQYFGGLDVAVNNAGFSFIGSLEELTDEEFRKALDINLFGTVNVIRASMAQFRKQRSGRVINIASAAGYIAGLNIGSYVASKFAIVGLTEALALEAKHLNIKPTVVLPGSFRTNFLDEGSLNYAKTPIAEYESADTYRSYAERAGKQPGDPQKLALELVNLANMENPPVHLILGPDSFKMIMDKRAQDLEEFEAFKKISLSTNFE